MADNLRFLLNNVNGLLSSKKHVKVFEYFKCQIANNGIIFLQETHFQRALLMNGGTVLKESFKIS